MIENHCAVFTIIKINNAIVKGTTIDGVDFLDNFYKMCLNDMDFITSNLSRELVFSRASICFTFRK